MCEHLLLFRASEAERATLAVVHDDEGVSQEDADDIDADEEEHKDVGTDHEERTSGQVEESETEILDGGHGTIGSGDVFFFDEKGNGRPKCGGDEREGETDHNDGKDGNSFGEGVFPGEKDVSREDEKGTAEDEIGATAEMVDEATEEGGEDHGGVNNDGRDETGFGVIVGVILLSEESGGLAQKGSHTRIVNHRKQGNDPKARIKG